MARIPMTSGFTLIPEGVHVFRIYEATYDEEFGKIDVKMVNAQGITHIERFRIKNANDELNEKALNAFSFFAKNAMNNFTMDDIDPEELVDHYIKGEIIHTKTPSTNDPTKALTFANIGEKSPADGFETTPTPRAMTLGKATTPATPTPTKGLNLDDLLG